MRCCMMRSRITAFPVLKGLFTLQKYPASPREALCRIFCVSAKDFLSRERK
jgi:hypothetical protein